MALIGSLNSGISALQNFARGLDVIGNNIANVNSVAFKGSRIDYTDSFSEFLKQPATSPTDGNGSNSSSSQIGLGVTVAAIQTSFLQGGLNTTGQPTDLAISGSGFFQVKSAQNNEVFATRAGDFRTDDRGYITTNDGYRLQGLIGGSVSYKTGVDQSGNVVFQKTVTAPSSLGDVRIDFNASIANGRVTTNPIQMDSTGAPILDSSGNTIPAVGTFITDSSGNLVANPGGTSYLVDLNGNPRRDTTGKPIAAPTNAELQKKVPQMQAWAVQPNGDLSVNLSNGDSFIGGKVLLMDFQDPTALVHEGSNLFSGFAAAGPVGGLTMTASNNAPGSYGLGIIQGGALELSNVDLTQQFADMITTQRSFQAGSRIITVSDSILQEVVDLKR